MAADIEKRISRELDNAACKAMDALSRYKFKMFGYWAAWWVGLNRLSGQNRPNPFRQIVEAARRTNGR